MLTLEDKFSSFLVLGSVFLPLLFLLLRDKSKCESDQHSFSAS